MLTGVRQPFHRTLSLDYGILTSGRLTLILDDDQRVVLSAGDVFVQRGTIHGWLNEADEWVRMYYVMLRELDDRLRALYLLTSSGWRSGEQGQGGREGA